MHNVGQQHVSSNPPHARIDSTCYQLVTVLAYTPKQHLPESQEVYSDFLGKYIQNVKSSRHRMTRSPVGIASDMFSDVHFMRELHLDARITMTTR